MERIQLTPVSGLAIPVQLSNYRAEGAALFCDEEVGQHYTTLPLPDGGVAYYPVDDNKDDPADSEPIYSESVEIVEQS